MASSDCLFKLLREARHSPEYEIEGLKLEIANALIKKMRENNINESELAKEMGVSPTHIANVLQGYRNLTLETLARLAFSLGSRWQVLMVPLEARENSSPVRDG